MEISKNIIKKLIVEVDTSSMAFGLQIKNDIDGFLQQHIYPKIESYLNQKIPENELWRYEKINLEIDLDSSESFKNVPAQIISKLERTFKDQSTDKSNGIIEEITPLSAPKSRVNAFIEFLKSGQYPWWFKTNETVTITDFIAVKNKLIKERIYSEINKTIAFNRLTHQFDTQFIIKYYYWYHFEDKIDTLPKEVVIPTLLDSNHKNKFWHALISHEKPKIASFFNDLIQQLGAKKVNRQGVQYQLSDESVKQLVNLIEFCNKTLKIGVALSPIKTKKNTLQIVVNSDYKKAILVNIETLQNIALESKNHRHIDAVKIILSGVKYEHEINQKIMLNSEEKIMQNTPSKLGENSADKLIDNHVQNDAIEEIEMVIDGTLIEKAGLVLLHPFLKHFFINMELVSENKIRPEKQDLAVHLLHYIATKNEQPSEHELVFEKYLCHIPVNHPINKFIELTSEQKNSCDELLQAVLKHWSALRTNSIDALRSEFLLRQGKLTVNDDRHRLYIQRNTQDILLDTLPWNLHLVKLPWKKQLLYVEW